MASKYGAYVHGVDLSVNMVTTALERAFAAKDGHKVSPLAHLLPGCRMGYLEASHLHRNALYPAYGMALL